MPRISRDGGPSVYGGDDLLAGSNYSQPTNSQRRPPRSPERQSRPTVREMESPSPQLAEPVEPPDIADSVDTSGHETVAHDFHNEKPRSRARRRN
jgi:hypothetical protein